ncbi:uncharacterized protein LOC127260802 [Andrographis paniculata]|uniref:uncharacterized protein LOC127260802 n=1 Tax=Andrographis paniculata TaxID=175694 RepID=UPI0021E77C0F|nr:uncharacterized protein LOC127260802 [Andrographis paniculata]
MGVRGFSCWVLLLLAALSIFPVAVAKDPFKSILGQENLGSWKDQILNSTAEAPGPFSDVGTLVLAENRTKRPDILSKFHKYRGGWDITNQHYWASVGFTGAAAFIVAVVWFFSFGTALVVQYFCGCKINLGYKESSWSLWIYLLLLVAFTTAAAVGCILLSVGQDDFHGKALDTLDYVVNQSEYTVHVLRNVTGYLSLAKTVNVAQTFLPSDVKDGIDKINVDLDNAADMLEQKTDENSRRIQKVFNTVRSSLIVVAAVMLLISIVGLVLSILRHQHVIHIFIVSGWLLVAVTLVLCGVFAILNNAISDTCLAMGEWVENPHAETALSNILPCVDQRTTNQTLFKSKQVINNIVNIVNVFVSSIANSNPPPQATPNYYNQSGPVVPQLCYPYDGDLQDRPCSPQELSMENASLAWQNFTCTMSSSGLCASVGRLTPPIYTELVVAVNVSYALEHYAPPLLSLQDCNFVRDTFTNITARYCPPLEHDLRLVNAGLALISVGVMLSLALWMLFANRPRREEVFAKLRGSCSGKNTSKSGNNSVATSTGTTPRIGA